MPLVSVAACWKMGCIRLQTPHPAPKTGQSNRSASVPLPRWETYGRLMFSHDGRIIVIRNTLTVVWGGNICFERHSVCVDKWRAPSELVKVYWRKIPTEDALLIEGSCRKDFTFELWFLRTRPHENHPQCHYLFLFVKSLEMRQPGLKWKQNSTWLWFFQENANKKEGSIWIILCQQGLNVTFIHWYRGELKKKKNN